MKIPVEGHRGLYRDGSTGAIINSNESEYNEYLKLKNIKLSEKNEIKILKAEIEELKTLIKVMLTKKI